jgi:hypothetical protein
MERESPGAPAAQIEKFNRFKMEATPGIEPGCKDLQSSA